MAQSYNEIYEPQFSRAQSCGNGRFASVYKCWKKGNKGTIYAAKKLKNVGARLKTQNKREIKIMEKIEKNDYTVKLMNSFADSNFSILILEYCGGGDLFDVLEEQESGVFTEEKAAYYTQQILYGIYYIHKANILHLDLKPENILCCENNSRIKIADFGLSVDLDLTDDGDARAMAGTMDYMCPESLNFEKLTKKSDMWSVGVIAYLLLSGLLPFQGDTEDDTRELILAVDLDYDDEEFDYVTDDAKALVTAILQQDAEERPSAQEALRHRFITPVGPRQTIRMPQRAAPLVPRCYATQCSPESSPESSPVVSRANTGNGSIPLSPKFRDNIKRLKVKRKWKKGVNSIRAINRFRRASTIGDNLEGKEGVSSSTAE